LKLESQSVKYIIALLIVSLATLLYFNINQKEKYKIFFRPASCFLSKELDRGTVAGDYYRFMSFIHEDIECKRYYITDFSEFFVELSELDADEAYKLALLLIADKTVREINYWEKYQAG